jgi:poly(hydroxyalkanoate) granule-associated protein
MRTHGGIGRLPRHRNHPTGARSMVKKVSKGGSAAKSHATANASPLAGAIKESAQQIWLAGLGAFSKAQEEGGKAFETLVKEGMSIQRKTQAVAEERISEATSRVSNMANEIQNKAAGQWDKLESLFEERVAKALGKLGVRRGRPDGTHRRAEQASAQAGWRGRPRRQTCAQGPGKEGRRAEGSGQARTGPQGSG